MPKKIVTTSGTAVPLRLTVKNDKLTITYQANRELLRHLETSWRERRDKVRMGFERFVRVQARAAVPARRIRRTTLNALVPEDLRKRFQDACEESNCLQDRAIKLVLDRYIDLKAKVRRVAHSPDRKILRDPFGEQANDGPGAIGCG